MVIRDLLIDISLLNIPEERKVIERLHPWGNRQRNIYRYNQITDSLKK
jgi:hypothetical protein